MVLYSTKVIVLASVKEYSISYVTQNGHRDPHFEVVYLPPVEHLIASYLVVMLHSS